jgi:hypothetical protein
MVRLSLPIPLLLAVAVPFFTLGLMRFWKWKRSTKGERPPFKDKLLRSPGEGLRREIADISDDVTSYIMSASTIPLLLYCIYTTGIGRFPPPLFWVVGGGFTLFCIWKTLTLISRRRDRRVGMAGEMATGEELNRLMLDGYHVYHDFPADRFNIDHILVGSSGVFAVETKARSKRRDGKPKSKVEVVYDGKQLRFPSWVTSVPIEQAKAQATWLSKWLSNAVGDPVRVSPMVTIPGWYIERRTPEGVPVLNPKEVKIYLETKSDAVLSESMIKRICHQLEQKCRDVDLWEWY